MVGIAQLVRAPDCGSGGPGFESQYPPLNPCYRRYSRDFCYCIGNFLFPEGAFLEMERKAQYNDGLSPSGKAQDFDSCIHQFESG